MKRPMTALHAATVVAGGLVLALGCTQRTGGDSSSTSSGGTSSSSGGGSSSVMDGPDITGILDVTNVGDGTPVVTPGDASALVVRAFVPDGSGGSTVITGSGTAQGTFVIPGVPAGLNLIQVGAQVVHTRARHLEFHQTVLGRSGTVAAPSGTQVSLSGNLAEPWAAGATLTVASNGVGATVGGPPFAAGAPAANANMLSGTRLNWTPPLVSSSAGDVLRVLQYKPVTLPMGLMTVLTGSYQDNGISFTGGRANNLNVTLAALPAQRTTHLAWLRSTYQGILEEMQPFAPASTSYQMFVISAVDDPVKGININHDLVRVTRFNNLEDEDLGEVEHPAPPPGHRAVVLSRMRRFRPVYAPGATTPVSTQADVTSLIPVEEIRGPMEAALYPVRNVTVDNVPATSLGMVATLTPTVRWDRPLRGNPTAYRVIFNRVENNNGTTRLVFAATVTTPQTQATLPDGLLQDGLLYVVTVTAMDTTVDLTTFPGSNVLGHRADYVTHAFTVTQSGTLPAPTCANARVVVGARTGPDSPPAACVKGPTTVTVPNGTVVELGEHTTGDRVSFTMPADTAHFGVVLSSVASTDRLGLAQGIIANEPEIQDWLLPDGGTLAVNDPDVDGGVPARANIRFAGSEDLAYGGLPTTSRMLDLLGQGGFPVGDWSFSVVDYAYQGATQDAGVVVGATLGNRYDVKVVLRPNGPATNARVDLDVHLAIPNLTAAQAESHPAVLRWIRTMQDYLGPTGMCLGTVTLHDVAPWIVQDRSTGIPAHDGDPCSPLPQLRALTTNTNALQVWLINSFDDPSVLGIAPSIPAMQGVNSTGSGVVLTQAFLQLGACTQALPNRSGCGPDQLAHVAIHELGHHLGLFHTTEQTASTWDPLRDTAECTCTNTCVGDMRAAQCGQGLALSTGDCLQDTPCGGGRNLMFWAVHNAPGSPEITPEQMAILRRHPLVH